MRDGTSSLEAMTTDELNISLALAAPGSAVAVPAERQLASIAFVLSPERMMTPAVTALECPCREGTPRVIPDLPKRTRRLPAVAG